MATVGAHLPPWSKENAEESGLFCQSDFVHLISRKRVYLSENLQLDDVWPHLRELHVLTKNAEQRLKHNKANPDMVSALLDHIESGPRWQYHALMRAMALTGQGHLIPQGDLKPEVYSQGTAEGSSSGYEDDVRPKALPKKLCKVILKQCESLRKSLMQRHVFDFDGDSGDDTIDILPCFITVMPQMKGKNQMTYSIPGKDILGHINGKKPQVIRLFAQPGDGKTSLLMHRAYRWSIDFPNQINNNLPTPWTTIVFIQARKIKTTMEEAIRESLGCPEADVDMMMEHITEGDGVAIFLDSLDEIRDDMVMKNVKHYIHQRKIKGGPTVLISARTDICSIDAQDIDRFLTLQGFTEHQGLEYVKLYTEMCDLPQKPQVLDYVKQHQERLRPVLTNPLRLYIFCALAVRGELDLRDDGEFNIYKLFSPVERYLLRRSGHEVTEEQSQDFYRLCIFGLLTNLREFTDDILEHFNISEAYHVFLEKTSRRGQDGALVSYYSFSHEMVYEYFASRFIHNLSPEDRKSFVLSICCNRNLRNVQRIVFELLLQDWSDQMDLIQFLVRCILILQFEDPKVTFSKPLYKLMHLQNKVKMNLSLEDWLYSNQGYIGIDNATAVCKKIDKAFDKHADTLRHASWLGDLNSNYTNTVSYVLGYLDACSPVQKEVLLQKTIFRLLPFDRVQHDIAQDRSKKEKYFTAGRTRWGHIRYGSLHSIKVYAWCPEDAADVLSQDIQGKPWFRNKILSMEIPSEIYTDRWGKTPDSVWSQEACEKLFRPIMQLRANEVRIQLSDEALLTGMLSWLADHATHLQFLTRLLLVFGRVELNDLVTNLSICIEKGLTVQLYRTTVIISSDVDEATLRKQRDKLHAFRNKRTKLAHRKMADKKWQSWCKVVGPLGWITETREYVWSV